MKKTIQSMLALAIAAFAFTACSDVPEPEGYNKDSGTGITQTEPAGDGTQANPYNVAGVINAMKTLTSGSTTTTDIYTKGYVVEVAEFQSQYSSINYYITDVKPGEGKGQKFYVYGGRGLGNNDFTSKEDLTVGDEVVVCGKITNYNGTIEYQSRNYIVSLNGKNAGGESTEPATPTGDGTLANPFNAAAANQEAAKLGDKEASTESYYIKGKVAKIAYNYGEGKFPKTADYYISEDGAEANTFYVYASKYLGNTDYSTGDVLKVGDEVIVYGQLYNYGGTYETATNKSYLYSLNGKTAETETTTTPESGDDSSTEAKVVTVAEFNAAAESTTVWYQLTGTVKNLKADDLYGNFDLEDATGSVYVYGLLSEKGGAKKLFQELANEQGIAEGSTITIIGNRGSYNGKIEVTNAYFVSISK